MTRAHVRDRDTVDRCAADREPVRVDVRVGLVLGRVRVDDATMTALIRSIQTGWQRTAGSLAVGVLVTSILVGANADVSSAAVDRMAIRKVDFKNFTYTDIEEGQPTAVVDGEFSRDDENGLLFVNVAEIAYGDLTGDGIEEAVVTIGFSTGGSGFFTDGRVFTLVSGRAVEVASLGVGDRADGGIDTVQIVRGQISVERFGNDQTGACCPSLLERSKWRLVKRGSTFVLQMVGQPYVRRFERLGLNVDGSEGPTKISFLKGTSEAVLEGYGGTSGWFEARKGQTATIAVSRSSSARVSVKVSWSTGSVTLKPGQVWTKVLPATGRYSIEVPATGARVEPTVRMTLTIR